MKEDERLLKTIEPFEKCLFSWAFCFAQQSDFIMEELHLVKKKALFQH